MAFLASLALKLIIRLDLSVLGDLSFLSRALLLLSASKAVILLSASKARLITRRISSNRHPKQFQNLLVALGIQTNPNFDLSAPSLPRGKSLLSPIPSIQISSNRPSWRPWQLIQFRLIFPRRFLHPKAISSRRLKSIQISSNRPSWRPWQ